jgi:formylmethanofuran dehydrogenase subunit E
METLKDFLDVGLEFHGHKCPAMPMGLRAGMAAMKALGVERAKDKELVVESETGEGHAAGCFLDGVMVATGATYGKGNIKKLFYNKMAFTLIEAKSGKGIRVSLKPDFFEKALQSPFVQERKKGVPPQDISPETKSPRRIAQEGIDIRCRDRDSCRISRRIARRGRRKLHCAGFGMAGI